MPRSPFASIDRGALRIVAAAIPVHAILALATDLSPDEAYYLCAARADAALPPIVDHPPLLPWLLRGVDRASLLPLELRVRLVPMACAFVLGVLCIELARRRGADRAGQMFAAWIGSFAILPTIAGFVATPDGPALIAIIAGLLWATPEPVAVALSVTRAPAHPSLLERAPPALTALALGVVLALGTLSKVVVLPAAVFIAALATGRSRIERLVVLAPIALCAPLFLPSLRFQLDHAFGGLERAWSAGAAASALAEAVLVQALLWSPGTLVWGAAAIPKLPRADRGLVASITALVGLSALVRAAPPEANWWAPAAVVVLAAAAARAETRSRRARWAVIATVILPATVALVHCIRPFLPLPPPSDPTARLHGWSDGQEPLDAAGIGPYGPAAERCIYRSTCDEITSYFNKINKRQSGSF